MSGTVPKTPLERETVPSEDTRVIEGRTNGRRRARRKSVVLERPWPSDRSCSLSIGVCSTPGSQRPETLYPQCGRRNSYHSWVTPS